LILRSDGLSIEYGDYGVTELAQCRIARLQENVLVALTDIDAVLMPLKYISLGLGFTTVTRQRRSKCTQMTFGQAPISMRIEIGSRHADHQRRIVLFNGYAPDGDGMTGAISMVFDSFNELQDLI
jgi:hypothetical protein